MSSGQTSHQRDCLITSEEVLARCGEHTSKTNIQPLSNCLAWLLGEAAGAPAGAIAQIMGHRPSATAEGYKPRSIDALRPYMAQIEAHTLALAGVAFVPAPEPVKLRVAA